MRAPLTPIWRAACKTPYGVKQMLCGGVNDLSTHDIKPSPICGSQQVGQNGRRLKTGIAENRLRRRLERLP